VSARWTSNRHKPSPGDQKTRDREGEPLCELPLREHPKTHVTWDHTMPRGSPDLCVRPLGMDPHTFVPMGRMNPPTGPAVRILR
jgi:hypothetical protein